MELNHNGKSLDRSTTDSALSNPLMRYLFSFITLLQVRTQHIQKFEFSGDVGDIGGICKIPWHYLKEF